MATEEDTMRKRTYATILLKASEAAERLGVSASTIFRLVRAGRLRSVLVGKQRRIPLIALDEFVAA